MTAERSVVVVESPEAVADLVAVRVIETLGAALTVRSEAHLVVTGGGVGTAALGALAVPARISAIDWSRVHVWWGDERFLPSGHPDRNETQAREVLLDRVPVPAELVHAMPAVGGGPWADDADAAAVAYARELAEAAGSPTAADGLAVPEFDVVLLGVGPDGHVASLFPEHPDQSAAPGVAAVGVHDSPKPPPTRISLTFEALERARQVWLLAAGTGKAEAVAEALSRDDRWAVPASGVRGREGTVWILDAEAASRTPGEPLSG